MRQVTPQFIILDAKATTGIGNAQLVESFRHLLLTLSSQANANFTVKFQGSNSNEMPNFATAKSATNEWDYVQVKDLQDNSSISGDTGVAFAGTDDVRQFEVNTNGLRWICAEITAISAGSVNVKGKGFNN